MKNIAPIMLMNPYTGSVQTKAEWSEEGYICKDSDLIVVVMDENGEWVEV